MSWWNSSWSYRKKLTFANNAYEAHTNFPVFVHLKDGGGSGRIDIDFADIKAAGADIRFIDDNDSTELKYEIVRWDDGAEEAWIFVKVPTLAKSDTDFIYIYYGNAAASDDQDVGGTWPSEFQNVYHLDSTADSSGNSRTLSQTGAVSYVTGKVNKAASADWKYANRLNSSTLAPGTGSLTICAFIKKDGVPTRASYPPIVAIGSGSVRIQLSADLTTGYLSIHAYDGSWTHCISAYNVCNNSYHWCVARRSGTSHKVYANGAEKESMTGTARNISNGNVGLGQYARVDDYDILNQAILDEVWILNVAKSANWIAAQYKSLTNDYISVGVREYRPLVHSMQLGLIRSFVLGPLGISHILRLGFVPSHSSTIDGLKTLKLGVVPTHVSVLTAAPLVKKLGFVPGHISIVYGVLTKKLGFVPSYVLGPLRLLHSLNLGFVPDHTSIVSGILTKKLGFVPDHISIVYGVLTKKLGFVPSYVLGPLGLLHILKLGLVPGLTSVIDGLLTKKLGFVPESTSTKITELLKKLGFAPSLTSVVYGVKTLKLGFVPSYTSIITGLLTKYLGLVPGLTSIVTGLLTKKLGLVPSHISTITGLETLKLGFVPSYTSIVYGLLTKHLGFVTIHLGVVSKFIIELRFYDRDGVLVKIISSKAQNFPLVDPGLEFTLLRDGGCGSFKFTTSEDLGIERGYRLDLYLYESLWYSGRLERVPEPGLSTSRTYKYSGFGFLSELNWKLIEEEYANVELSAIVTDILEKYYYSKSDILEE